MDPNEALKRVREGLALIERTPDNDSTVDLLDDVWDDVHTHVVALVQWIEGGGFLPFEWVTARERHLAEYHYRMVELDHLMVQRDAYPVGSDEWERRNRVIEENRERQKQDKKLLLG